MRKCEVCGTMLDMEWGNLSFSKDDIEIFLQETPYYVCPNCRDTILTDDVKKFVQNMLEEKKKYPDSPPVLYIHVRELLNCAPRLVTVG